MAQNSKTCDCKISHPLNSLIKKDASVSEIRKALMAGADPNAMDTNCCHYCWDKYSHSPLYYMASRMSWCRNPEWYDKVVDLLVEHGADPDMRCWEPTYIFSEKPVEKGSEYFRTPLQVAAAKTNYYAMKALLKYVKPDSDCIFNLKMSGINGGCGPIMNSQSIWEARCMDALFEEKCQIVKREEDNLTPLMYHVKNAHLFAVNKLLKYAKAEPELCDVNDTDLKGNTALHHLASSRTAYRYRLSILRGLLNAGANPLIKNNEGKTALQVLFENLIEIGRSDQRVSFWGEKIYQAKEWIRELSQKDEWIPEIQNIMEMPDLIIDENHAFYQKHQKFVNHLHTLIGRVVEVSNNRPKTYADVCWNKTDDLVNRMLGNI